MIHSVKLLLNWGDSPVPDVSSKYPRSGLGCAARDGRAEIVKLLLAAGGDPDQKHETVPAVFLAGKHPAIARMLIDSGANPRVTSTDGYCLAHFFRFESAGDVDWLVGLGVDLQSRPTNGTTPLHSALRYASTQVLDALVRHGVDVRSEPLAKGLFQSANRNSVGTAWLIDKGVDLVSQADLLSYAINGGDEWLPVVEALIRTKVNVDQRDQNGMPVVFLAIRSFAPSTLRTIVEQIRADGGVLRTYQMRTPLQYAKDIPIRRSNLGLCVDCDMTVYLREQELKHNNPEALADRQRRKDEMILYLQHQEEQK